jgi:hypothetical protein
MQVATRTPIAARQRWSIMVGRRRYVVGVGQGVEACSRSREDLVVVLPLPKAVPAALIEWPAVVRACDIVAALCLQLGWPEHVVGCPAQVGRLVQQVRGAPRSACGSSPRGSGGMASLPWLMFQLVGRCHSTDMSRSLSSKTRTSSSVRSCVLLPRAPLPLALASLRTISSLVERCGGAAVGAVCWKRWRVCAWAGGAADGHGAL